MADLQTDTTTVDHAAGVFADILKREAETPPPDATEPEPKEPPSRFALPGKPEVEVEEEAQESSEDDAGQAQIEGADLTPTEPKPTTAAKDARQQQEAAERTARETAERNQAVQQLNSVVQQLRAGLQGEFADIKTYDDLERVAATDPDRYNHYVIAQGRLNQAVQVQNGVQQQLQAQAMQQFQAWQAKEQERLPELIPDLKDPEKAPATAAKILAYATKAGYSAEQMARASASDIAQLHKAMSYDDWQANTAKEAKQQAKALADAKAKAANAPPVQKPGAQRTTSKDDLIQTDFRRLRKTGSVDDAAALFKRMGL